MSVRAGDIIEEELFLQGELELWHLSRGVSIHRVHLGILTQPKQTAVSISI